MSNNFTFPLRDYEAKYDYKLSNPNGKLSDVWLHKEYQKLSLQTAAAAGAAAGATAGATVGATATTTTTTTNTSSRERRKRNVGEVGGSSEDDHDMVAYEDVMFSDTDSVGTVSGGDVFVIAGGGNVRKSSAHPPKRRLTTLAVSENINSNRMMQFQIDSPGCIQQSSPLASRQQSGVATFSSAVTTTTTTSSSADSHTMIRRPRTPNAINSPSHTPVSDEDDPIQQLPLPSPSASPIESEHPKLNFEPIERSLSNVPTTQAELIDLMTNLFGYFNERNQNHFIFKLLQNVNRASLSTFNGLIHNSLKRDLLTNLPLEITMKILSFLDFKTLLTLSLVCKSWYDKINNPNLWINLLIRDKLITNPDIIKQELTDPDIIKQELTDPDQLLQQWCRLPNVNPAQVLYKKRSIIVNRWMDPNYQPKRISVTGHGNKVVTCLQHDDEKIVTGVDDKCILIYSTKTGKLMRVLEGHEGGVWALKYTGNTLVTGSTDRTVRVWNMKTGICTHVFRGHTSTIRCLDIIHPAVVGKDVNGNDLIFPQFPLLVTGSRDHNIHVWKLPLCDDNDEEIDEVRSDNTFDSSEIDNPYLIAVLSGHTQSVRSISGFGNIIISGSYDSTVRVWDLLDNGNCKHILTGHQDRVYSTAMDFHSKICFSGSMDSTINMWSFETGKLIKTLEGHSSLVGLLSLVDGVLVSAAADASLRIWNPTTGDIMSKLKGHGAAITCFEHDGLRVVSGSEKMLKLWDVKRGCFARDLLADVTGGIWQVRIDYKRCVAAVQRFNEEEEGETFIEILDFSEPPVYT